MERDPADCEEEKDQEKRGGRFHLSAYTGCGPGLSVTVAALLCSNASHLLLDHDEDSGVDEEHDHQRSQDAGKEVEIDHVGHVHHQDKEAVARVRLFLVPAHQRHEADEKGQQPRRHDHQCGVARRHQHLVPEGHEDGHVALHSDCQQAEDGALGEHDQDAQHQQTQVEPVTRQTHICQDGAGNGYCAHTDVSHCQRDQEVVGDSAEFAVESHGGAHH